MAWISPGLMIVLQFEFIDPGNLATVFDRDDDRHGR